MMIKNEQYERTITPFRASFLVAKLLDTLSFSLHEKLIKIDFDDSMEGNLLVKCDHECLCLTLLNMLSFAI